MNKEMMNGMRVGVVGIAALLAASPSEAIDVAKVNGKGLTEAEVRGALGSMPEGQRAAMLRDKASRRRLVAELVDQEVLVQQASKEKLDQAPEFKQAIESFKRQYLSNQLLMKNLGAKMTENAAKAYYKSHISEFSTDTVHVQHILAQDEFTARNLLAEVKKPGADFQVIAENSSRDPSAKNNRGEVGWVTRSSPMAREFKDAAFSGSKGDIVGPVQTAFGFHLIKVVDKRVGKALEYDEVELQVKAALREELARVYLTNLRKQAKVQIDEKAIESL